MNGYKRKNEMKKYNMLPTIAVGDRYKTFTMHISRAFFESPARISIIGFAVLISIGTVLLMLPFSPRSRRGFV